MVDNKIDFIKVYPVKTPQRAHPTDVGTDFFIPEASQEFIKELQEKNINNNLIYTFDGDEYGNKVLRITIPAGSQVNIPSGIKVNIHDKTTYLDAQNKSGVASKLHLVTGAKIIDPDYQGVIHINMLNVGNTPVTIQSGQKIVQFIHKSFINTDWAEISEEQYNAIGTTDRGEGGFGSSGTK